MSDVAVQEEKLVLVLPDLDDTEEVNSFITTLTEHESKRGIPKLLKSLGKYQKHADISNRLERAIRTSVKYVNGERTASQRRGDKKMSLRSTAQKFFESLDTKSLRMQCSLFSVAYDSYETQEDIIAALVQKQLEMVPSDAISNSNGATVNQE